ncbi:hypothetical protein F5Y13DRAFT_206801 [Hypoxylon sp. FL1857]|nr:hypothetical protein F5Y13DRAFT_206801 [Hypoxylon sp. FL1857]
MDHSDDGEALPYWLPCLINQLRPKMIAIECDIFNLESSLVAVEGQVHKICDVYVTDEEERSRWFSLLQGIRRTTAAQRDYFDRLRDELSRDRRFWAVSWAIELTDRFGKIRATVFHMVRAMRISNLLLEDLDLKVVDPDYIMKYIECQLSAWASPNSAHIELGGTLHV